MGGSRYQTFVHRPQFEDFARVIEYSSEDELPVLLQMLKDRASAIRLVRFFPTVASTRFNLSFLVCTRSHRLGRAAQGRPYSTTRANTTTSRSKVSTYVVHLYDCANLNITVALWRD